MKRFFGVVLVALLMAFGLAQPVWAVSVQILTSGEATGDDYDAALSDAYRCAILKGIVQHFTTDAETLQRNDIMQDVMTQRTKYIVGKPQIMKKYRKDGKSYVICKVMVDIDALKEFAAAKSEAVNAKVKVDPNSYDSQVYFAIRLRGNIDNAASDAGSSKAMDLYSYELNNLRFRPALGEFDDVVEKLGNVNNTVFFHEMEENLKTADTLGNFFAIVCDIAVTPGRQTEFGANSAADVLIRAYDLRGCKGGKFPPEKIIEYAEHYERHKDKLDGVEGANSFVIEQAASSSAHYIAGKLYEYWQNHH